MVEVGIVMLNVPAKSILKDIVATGDQIRGSGLDWTLIRLASSISLNLHGLIWLIF
jgi:hypothetical protein